jgi:hypothetical protein
MSSINTEANPIRTTPPMVMGGAMTQIASCGRHDVYLFATGRDRHNSWRARRRRQLEICAAHRWDAAAYNAQRDAHVAAVERRDAAARSGHANLVAAVEARAIFPDYAAYLAAIAVEDDEGDMPFSGGIIPPAGCPPDLFDDEDRDRRFYGYADDDGHFYPAFSEADWDAMGTVSGLTETVRAQAALARASAAIPGWEALWRTVGTGNRMLTDAEATAVEAARHAATAALARQIAALHPGNSDDENWSLAEAI